MQSLAAVSAERRYVKPAVSDEYDLHIDGGRHPVVEAVMEGSAFMANGAQLSRDAARMLLITGPNMAGKSTYMRQTALICIMAQIGCFVPARSARLPCWTGSSRASARRMTRGRPEHVHGGDAGYSADDG